MTEGRTKGGLPNNERTLPRIFSRATANLPATDSTDSQESSPPRKRSRNREVESEASLLLQMCETCEEAPACDSQAELPALAEWQREVFRDGAYLLTLSLPSTEISLSRRLLLCE